MQVTLFTDYSIRMLIYLALNPQQRMTIFDVAQSYNISKNHLMKIAQELNIRGYIIATRGKNGGLKLARCASQINIGTLVRELEGKEKLIECFGENNQCVITPSCQLNGILKQAIESFYSTLDNYCLSDIIGDEHTQSDLVQLISRT